MKLPSLMKIIERLEKVPVKSWKGFNRGISGPWAVPPMPENKTDEIYSNQDAYAFDIDGYEFVLFRGRKENKYSIRISNSGFRERIDCELKGRGFFESKDDYLKKNEEYFRLQALDKKLHNYGVELGRKEKESKSKIHSEALKKIIEGED